MSAEEKLSIVFVDDEQLVLDGLRRQLAGRRGEWDMRFVDSGAAALRELETRRADVIVSDMQMPGMDGTQLLCEVHRRWPATVRLVLSGQIDQTALVRGVGVIHQFLQKPCETSSLCSAINTVRPLIASGETAGILTLVPGLRSLPVLPDTLAQLIVQFNHPIATMAQVVSVIERDVGLSVKLLQLVNSAFFGVPRRVSSVRQAVMLLGLGTVRSVAMATCVFDTLAQDGACVHEIAALLNQSIRIGAVASDFAKRAAQPPSVVEYASLAGGLSLVGRSILLRCEPEQFKAARRLADEEQMPLYQAEVKRFGVSQQMVGGFALGLWGFHSSVVEAVVHQADPQTSTAAWQDHPLCYVHLARCAGEPGFLLEKIDPCISFIEALGLEDLITDSSGITS